MSGGERKKRLTHEQAWEEAGSEFYQESYAGAQEDLEAFQRDPNHLKTLLPSKQNRGAGESRRDAEIMLCHALSAKEMQECITRDRYHRQNKNFIFSYIEL